MSVRLAHDISAAHHCQYRNQINKILAIFYPVRWSNAKVSVYAIAQSN